MFSMRTLNDVKYVKKCEICEVHMDFGEKVLDRVYHL